MFLLELVMQGVREFGQLVRLRFQRGFNFIAAGNEGGKTTTVDTIVRLLFPNDAPGAVDSLVSRATPDTSRGALVVFPGDSEYFRVIHDFSKRGVNLSKYNAGTKGFDLMNSSWDGVADFMGGLMNGVSEQDFRRLFVLQRDQASGSASHRPPQAATTTRAPQVRPAAASAGPTPAQEARLAQLRQAMLKADEAADAEYKLEAAKIKLGEITRKLETLEENRGRISDIQANLESLKGCEQFPENISELLDGHERSQGQKMAKTDEIQQDIDGLKMQRDGIPSAPFWKDPLFFLGAAVGAGSLVAGLFILSAEQADYFLIGIILSLGLVIAAWYRVSRRNAQRSVLQKEIEAFETEFAEIEKSFSVGGAQIQAYMDATASTTTAELKDRAENFRYFQSQLADMEEQRKHMLGGIRQEELRAEYVRLQQEVIELEKAARALAAYSVDTYSLRQEIDRIESETSAASPSWDFGSPEQEPFAPFSASAEPGNGQGIFLPELALASRASGIEMETLVPAVEAAAQRNLAAVTGGRYVKVEAGHDGDPAVFDKDHVRVEYAALSHSMRELLYLCLRAGLVEAVTGKLRLPFLVDDAIAGLDPARQRAACQILRALGAKTQVLLFSSNSVLREQGDAFAELAA